MRVAQLEHALEKLALHMGAQLNILIEQSNRQRGRARNRTRRYAAMIEGWLRGVRAVLPPAATQEQPAGSGAAKHKLAAWDDLQCKNCGLGRGRWPSEPNCTSAALKPQPYNSEQEFGKSGVGPSVGSPRKVGEDGAQASSEIREALATSEPTFADALKWLLKQGHIMGIRDYPTGLSIAEAMVEELCERRDVVSIVRALAPSRQGAAGK